MDEAMARVEAQRKELADAKAAKAAGKTKPMTMEEARRIRIERAKALQKERRRIEAEQKAQEEAKATKAAQTQETEVVDLSRTIEYLKKLEREKHTAEQRAAQLAREKIKEALSRKAKEPVLEPTQGSPKRPRQEEEEEIQDIQADPIPPSSINIPPAPPSSPITPFPPASTPQTPPSPLPLETTISPPAPTSPQQQHLFAEPSDILASLTEEIAQPMEAQTLQEETTQPMDKSEEQKQTDGEQQQPAKVDVPILIVQEEEPTSQEAILEEEFDAMYASKTSHCPSRTSWEWSDAFEDAMRQIEAHFTRKGAEPDSQHLFVLANLRQLHGEIGDTQCQHVFLGSLTRIGVMDAQSALGGVQLCIYNFLTYTQLDTGVGGVPSWNTYADYLAEAAFTMAYEFMVADGVVIALCMPEQYIPIV
ncbi:hypothetical protein L7F22_017020 [Adiantum nelumboides]|nr:hypothetical protein [Adiantum nelumboides]